MDRPKSFQWVGEPQARRRNQTPDPVQRPPRKPRVRLRPLRFRFPFRIRWRYVIAVYLLIVVLATAAVGYWIQSLDIDKLAIPVSKPTQLLDINGKPASQISTVKTDPVPLYQIPVHMQQAIVAVEDRRFYTHKGVDVPGILRAAFHNAKAGGVQEGASTITQQLAKNVFLSSRRTFSRKLTEAAYAFKIESTYDKDRILEMYLNQIYFGEGQWGIGRAAKRYFGKEAQQLTLSESALLAALPKAPSRYSPFRNKDLAMERRNLVLDLMRQANFISTSECEQAKSEPIRLAGHALRDNSLQGKYGSFADAVIDEAINRYGFTERQLMAGDLLIYTTLDPVVQNAMEQTYRNDDLFPPSSPDQLIQSGAVILNPHTGGIRGIVGQRGEHVFRGFNHATQLRRQPGSSFKPIMVYAPAMQKGYNSESMLYDGPLNINGYQPENSDHQHRGQVSLHDAVVHSINVPAVWLLNEIGVPTGKAFVQKLGIPLQPEDNNLGMALGGLSKGVSPLEMAQAYSVFPTLGEWVPAHAIVKITTAEGTLLAQHEAAATQLLSKENAFAMTDVLQDAVREGTGTRAALDRPTAGKTGTTQLPPLKEFQGIEGGTKDVWFVGYTPELVGAVWMGYDVTDAKHYLSTSGGYYPALVFKEMMSLALKDAPVTGFKMPKIAPARNTDNYGSDHQQQQEHSPHQKHKKQKHKQQSGDNGD